MSTPSELHDISTLVIEPPTNLAVGTRTISSIVYAWNASTTSGATYEYRFKLSSAQAYPSTWIEIDDPTITLTGLIHNTSYDFQVRSVVGTQRSSIVSRANTSTLTLNPPTGLMSSAQRGTEIDYEWTASTTPGVTGYEYRHKLSSVGAFSGSWITVTGTTLTVTGLTESTAYDIQVRSVVGTQRSAPVQLLNTNSGTSSIPPMNFRLEYRSFTQVRLLVDSNDLVLGGFQYRFRNIRFNTAPPAFGGWTNFSGGVSSVMTDVSVSDDNSYEFEVRSVMDSGRTKFSDPAEPVYYYSGQAFRNIRSSNGLGRLAFQVIDLEIDTDNWNISFTKDLLLTSIIFQGSFRDVTSVNYSFRWFVSGTTEHSEDRSSQNNQTPTDPDDLTVSIPARFRTSGTSLVLRLDTSYSGNTAFGREFSSDNISMALTIP